MTPAAERTAARVEVVAVIVSHGGAEWLPRVLSSLADSTRAPDLFIGVDTGSADGSAHLLREAIGAENVIDVDHRTGFGAAVASALATRPASDDGPGTDHDGWVWLLHDDCAPHPEALANLLRVARSDPRIAAVGCKI